MEGSEFTLNYLGDIMFFSKMWESHLRQLKEVFKWLQYAGLKIKLSKCEFSRVKSTIWVNM